MSEQPKPSFTEERIRFVATWRWADGTPLTDEEQERARRLVGQRMMDVFNQSEAARTVAPMLQWLQEKGATEEELEELLTLTYRAWAVPERFDDLHAAMRRVMHRLGEGDAFDKRFPGGDQ
jgi:hypothetical protein